MGLLPIAPRYKCAQALLVGAETQLLDEQVAPVFGQDQMHLVSADQQGAQQAAGVERATGSGDADNDLLAAHDVPFSASRPASSVATIASTS